MKTYNIYYDFSGCGVAIVKAKNKKEAMEKYENGEALYKDGEGCDYQFDFIEESK